MAWESADGVVTERLAAALRTISIASGYHHTVLATSVATDPAGLLTVSPSELPYLVLQADEGRWDGAFAFQRVVRARWRVLGRIDVEAPSERHRAALNLAEDIERAIGRDRTLGGAVIEADAGAPTIWLGLAHEPTAIVEVPVEALYVRAAAA